MVKISSDLESIGNLADVFSHLTPRVGGRYDTISLGGVVRYYAHVS
jgi:hypothetical protein